MSVDLFSLLLFGGLVGMQHALEADHLAAVAAVSAGEESRRRIVLRGVFWGTGHTLSLGLICTAVVALGLSISKRVESALELGVGLVVVLLGANVVRTVMANRIHFHVHDHGDRIRHVHAHSHAGDAQPHEKSGHHHDHPSTGFGRALAVGLVHGAAGSAGLLVLAVAAADSAIAALAYVAAFGLGSIAGMAALSFVASFPLRALERGTSWLNITVKFVIGAIAIMIGGQLMAKGWAEL